MAVKRLGTFYPSMQCMAVMYFQHRATVQHVLMYAILCSTPWAPWAAVSHWRVPAAVSRSSASTRTSSATAAANATSSPTNSVSGSSPSPVPPTTTSTSRDRPSGRSSCWIRSVGVACACWIPSETTST